MKCIGRVAAIILITIGFPAVATVVKGLSTVNILVKDRSSQTFAQVLPAAIGQALVRISGNTSVMTLPVIQNQTMNPQRFVTRYYYAENKNPDAKNRWILHISFDRKALHRLLQQAGQAIWGANRPKTLFWFSIPEEDRIGVLASGDQKPLLNQIKEIASNRGLPYLLPTMDLQDEANVSSDVSQLPTEKALQAEASRYGVESVLAVAIGSNDSGNLQAAWKLILDGTPYAWQQQGNAIATLLSDGLNNAADMMANRFATLANKALESNLLLQVSGVDNLQDYSRVIYSLRRLTPVGSVKVVELSQHNLLLKVEVSGGGEVLAQALKMLVQFRPEQGMAPSPLQSADLYYHYGAAK